MGEQQRPTGTGASDEEQRQRRLSALRDLARGEQGEPSAGAAPPSGARPASSLIASPARSRPWWAPFGAALAALLVAAALGAYLLHSAQPSPTASLPAMLTITTNACPSQEVWSPDGRTLAVLAFPCVGNGGSSSSLRDGVITLYNAATGRAGEQFSLAPILTDPNAAGGVLDGIGWSPDGHQIVLEVNASADLATGPTTSYLLVLLPIQGGQAQTITGTPAPSTVSTQNSQAPIWNVRTKRLTGMEPVPVPVALNYGWTEDGKLVGRQSFPSPGAVTVSGRPTGAGVVSFWEDGTLRPVFALSPSGFPDETKPPVAVEFSTGPRAVWSPDGSLVTFAMFSGLLAGDQPLTSALCTHLYLYAPTPACPDAVIAPADPAVAALVTQAHAAVIGTTSGGERYALYPGLFVAWNPQGTAVATVLPSDQFLSSGLTPAGSQKTQVTLLGTDGSHSGARTYTCHGAACSTDALAWSPSGAQLALMDSSGPSITLWSVR